MTEIDLNKYAFLWELIEEIKFIKTTTENTCKVTTYSGETITGSVKITPQTTNAEFDAMAVALKKLFDKQQLSVTELTFFEALSAMENGNSVARKSWSEVTGKRVLSLEIPTRIPQLKPYLTLTDREEGITVGYNLSLEEIMAKDWLIVPENMISK